MGRERVAAVSVCHRGVAVVVCAVAMLPLLPICIPAQAATRRLTARLADVRASAVLRSGRVRVRVFGSSGTQVRVTLTLLGTGRRASGRQRLATGVRATDQRSTRIGRRGYATITVDLTAAGRKALRAAIAGCRPVRIRIHLLSHRRHVHPHAALRSDASCRHAHPGVSGVPSNPAHPGVPGLPATPGGGYTAGTAGQSGGPNGPAAVFRVGAAVGDFSPPLSSQVQGGDPAACDPTGQFNGPAADPGGNRFAFVEPYQDAKGSGHYDGPVDATSLLGGTPNPSSPPYPGDPYLDCNHNGRWEGNLIGGGSNDPRFYTKVADPVTARAMVASNGQRTIAVEVVDQEGLFNVYQDQIRQRVVTDGYKLDNVFISATHDESAPDSLGLGGVNPITSGVNDYWLSFFVTKSAQAIEQAYKAMRPATIRYTEVLEPANVRQCFSSYPFTDDQHMPVLQAVGTDGKPIVTLADVSQHTETTGFNHGAQKDGTTSLDTENTWLTADWPYFFRSRLEQHYGGVAIEMAGSVGSVESPEVYPSPISRTPQQLVNASHPAGCRTLFNYADPNPKDPQDAGGDDHTPLGYNGETQAYGEQLAGPVISALDSGSYSNSASNDIWGDRVAVCVPNDNILFAAAETAGVFAHRPAYNSDCSQQVPATPSGTTTGTSLLTAAAAFRIGDGEFLSIPGEVFPFTYLRGFQGPNDMPNPAPALPAWLMTHLNTPFRFINGLAEDMIGYIFPQGNAVGIPTTSNPNPSGPDRFGCGHSDDSESASATSADRVANALLPLLDQHGTPETTVPGRYVLPSGAVSRDPLGGPEIKCDNNSPDSTTFTPDGPALAVDLPNVGIVHPIAWMSLSGLPQTTPDRDTRGFFDADGRRVWLDVYPDVTVP